MPNNKTDMNDTPHAPVRLSMPDINDAYPDGNAATRRCIIQQHYYYNIGLLYFLQNDDAVPKAIRGDARRWGFCRDEFVATGGISPKLYIREARRLVGQHVFTGRDTRQADDDARWAQRQLREEVIKRGIVEDISLMSFEHAAVGSTASASQVAVLAEYEGAATHTPAQSSTFQPERGLSQIVMNNPR